MITFLSYLPIIIAGFIILLGGILIIDHDRRLELEESHSKLSKKKSKT